jgi:hypothetical protein
MARGAGAVVAVALALVVAPAAHAFDTGPHGDLTVDAMRAEGFGPDAADVGRVNNWFVDLYSQASTVPHSGHNWLNRIIGGALLDAEHWPDNVVEAVPLLHFDYSDRPVIDGTAPA